MISPELRRWLAFGTGIGIEVAGADLHIVVAKVRPSGARVLGTLSIANLRKNPPRNGAPLMRSSSGRWA